MILGTLDDIEDDASPMPFRTRVGRRALPPREIAAVEPEPMTPLDRAVMRSAYGGVWLRLSESDVKELAGLAIVGVVCIQNGHYQLTLQGAREMGLLPAGDN